MERLKTFLTYALILIAFFLVSVTLEKGLIKDMYYDMTGTVNSILEGYKGQNIDLNITVEEAKSTNINGYITLNITNNSSVPIEEAYLKVDLYSKSDVHAVTKYMEINNLSAGETRNYTLRFQGSYIKRYAISAETEFPDKDYIFTVFGYEINTRNIFGMDLSEYINAKTLGEFASNTFHSITIFIKSIPWWGWFLAWTVVAGIW